MIKHLQTAVEIAKEYESMALETHYQYYNLKQQNPHQEFPALARHESFCCKMYAIWESITELLKIQNSKEVDLLEQQGNEMYGDIYDDWPRQDWGMNE